MQTICVCAVETLTPYKLPVAAERLNAECFVSRSSMSEADSVHGHDHPPAAMPPRASLQPPIDTPDTLL